MKLVSLVGEDCGGMPALALRKYTDKRNSKLATQTAVFDTGFGFLAKTS